MSTLREAAQDALTAYETFRDVDDIDGLDDAMDRLRAALAQPEAEPVAWRVRWIDPEEGPGDWVPTRDPDFYRSRPTYEVRPLYAHPPRDEWRPANEPPTDGRRVLIWVATESGEETFRPAYCPVGGWTSVFDGETLVAWRDVTPPGSDNIHNIRPLYAHPPRDEWRLASEPPEDDRSVLVWMPGKLGGLAIGRCSRGNWSPYYLGSPVTHWRDVTPPTESPIAAKCQRIE